MEREEGNTPGSLDQNSNNAVTAENLSSHSESQEKATPEKRGSFDEEICKTVLVSPYARTENFLKDVERPTQLKQLCIKYMPFWNDLSEEDIEIKIITNSLTNKVYMVKLQNPEFGSRRINKILLRIIDSEKMVLYDIDHQNEVCQLLSDYGFCPKTIKVFPGGRIEQWLEGYVLSQKNLSNLSVLTTLATLLAKFHKTITAVAPDHWDKNPMFFKTEQWYPVCVKINEEYNLGIDMEELRRLYLDYKSYLSNYLATNNISVSKTRSGEKGDNILVDNDHLKDNEDDLVNLGANYGNNILFCHNDIHLKNLIATYDGLTLIDFEYSSFNYVGAEIGYLFMESDFDYDCEEYPYFRVDRSLELTHEVKAIFSSVYLSESLGVNVLPTRTEIIEPFLKSVELHSLGTLIFWAYWGIIMNSLKETNNHFAYPEYTKVKVELFKEKFREFKERYD